MKKYLEGYIRGECQLEEQVQQQPRLSKELALQASQWLCILLLMLVPPVNIPWVVQWFDVSKCNSSQSERTDEYVTYQELQPISWGTSRQIKPHTYNLKKESVWIRSGGPCEWSLQEGNSRAWLHQQHPLAVHTKVQQWGTQLVTQALKQLPTLSSTNVRMSSKWYLYQTRESYCCVSLGMHPYLF